MLQLSHSRQANPKRQLESSLQDRVQGGYKVGRYPTPQHRNGLIAIHRPQFIDIRRTEPELLFKVTFDRAVLGVDPLKCKI